MGEQCEDKKECCKKEKKEECGTGCEMTDKLLCLAHDAWEDLFKEKVKAHYEKVLGEKMNKSAEVTAEAAIDFWQMKMQGKQKGQEHSQKIRQSFSE
tara:strand:- start:70389 stop:70679 length:291 start_codon:yes stop_codon:yes gene_type:complete